MKEFVGKYEFKNEAEEVSFFRETKPVFLSQFYYYNKRYLASAFSIPL